MPLDIIVTVKQVLDPETPASVLRINPETHRMEAPANIPPVVNGFDENAVEAALQLREKVDGKVTILSVGSQFAMDVIKKTLSMGADDLVLVQGEGLESLDPFSTALILGSAIRKIGNFNLVLCGRQASDFDQAQVPLALAEVLSIPAITLAQKVEVQGSKLVVDRVMTDGYDTVESSLPALVTVSNEIGQARYPTLRGIMAASRKQPTVWSIGDLGISAEALLPKLEIRELFVPTQDSACEFIDGSTDEEKGTNLALKLREMKLI
jgi:electron transfer flavoprotein beta subunit